MTDSAADFELHELRKLDVVYIPMQITVDDNEYTENENLTKEEFYQRLEKSGNFPKTSQPTPYDFESLLQGCMDLGHIVLL